jgi:hypothetical protein
MKKQLFRILVAIGVGFFVSQTNAQQNSLTYGIDRSTGNLIATDVWNGREYDKMFKDTLDMFNRTGYRNAGYSILANTFELETNGTTLNGSMIVAFRDSPGTTEPTRYLDFFMIQTSDNAESLGLFYDPGSLGKVYYGWSDQLDAYTAKIPSLPISRLKVVLLSSAKTQLGEALWILKANYSVELQRPIDYIPNIDIRFEIGPSGIVTRRFISRNPNKTTVSDIKRQLQQSIVTATNLAKANKPTIPATSVAPPPDRTTSALPEITLSITNQNGFLLITFSPVVTNANLEQANVNSNPWAWQPAVTATNSATNGWYVVPTLEPRVFRIRIDQ